MHNEELFEEIEDKKSLIEAYLGFSLEKFSILFMIVVAFGIYLGVLLYGTNSLEVLLNLEDYESYLQSEISDLKLKNAQLQHEYFELKEIAAQ